MKRALLRQTPLSWTLYMVECGDGTIYTGITTDLPLRLKAHTNGKGAKYTRGRGPFHVLYTEIYSTKGEALQREAHIKLLDARGKRALASDTHKRPSPEYCRRTHPDSVEKKKNVRGLTGTPETEEEGVHGLVSMKAGHRAALRPDLD
jgi:putative endonuclease